jgi:hypothetical protein
VYNIPTNVLGIYDRKGGLKVFAFDVPQRNNSRERFVVTDAELGE